MKTIIRLSLVIMIVLSLVQIGSAADAVFNGSTGWQNTSMDNATIIQSTSNIELKLISPDFMSMWRSLKDENTTTARNAFSQGGVTIISDKNITLDGSTGYLNFSTNPVFGTGQTIISKINYNSNTDANAAIISRYTAWYMATDGLKDNWIYSDGTNSTVTATTQSFGIDYILGGRHNSTHNSIWVNGLESSSVPDTSPDVNNVGSNMYIGKYYDSGYFLGGRIYYVILYNRSLTDYEMLNAGNLVLFGNLTTWQDFGSGRQGSQVRFNFTNATGLYVEGRVSTDNFTISDVLISDNMTNATLIDIPSGKNQTQYVRAVIKGNITNTPEIIEITITDEVAGGIAPTITSWSNNKTNNQNLTSITVNVSESINFNATANNTPTYSWNMDGIDQSVSYDNLTTSWSTTGTRIVQVNASNEYGSDYKNWTVYVVHPNLLGNNYYVATWGNNLNDGMSIDTPKYNWSISWFNATNIKPGDIIYLIDGVWYNESISIPLSGNVTNIIKITSYNNTPILDGMNLRTSAITGSHRSYLMISNLTFMNYTNYAILLTGGSDDYNVTISNNIIRDGLRAIYIQEAGAAAGFSNVYIINNTIYNTTTIATNIQALYLKNSSISGNLIYNSTGAGIDVTYGGNLGGTLLVQDNTIHDLHDPTGTATETGIFGGVNKNTTILNNTIYTVERGIRFTQSSQDTFVTGNTIYDVSMYSLNYYAFSNITTNNNNISGTINCDSPTYLLFENNTINGGIYLSPDLTTTPKRRPEITIIRNNTFTGIVNALRSTWANETIIMNNIFIGTSIQPEPFSTGNSPNNNLTIINNVFYNVSDTPYSPSDSAITLGLSPINHTIIKNNIFMNIKGYAVDKNNVNIENSSVIVQYNMLFNTSGFYNLTDSYNINNTDALFVDDPNLDFHLKSQYNRWNTSTQTWVQDAVTSPAIGAGDPASDNSLSPWGGYIEIGAYGNTAEASDGNAIYSISGYVNDSTSTLLSTVSITYGIKSNTTDSNGYYYISNMSNGTYNFSYTKAGYITNYKEITIDGADATNQNVTLNLSASSITIPANSWGMFNNWSENTNFSSIASNESNDVTFTFYNVTSGEWDSYYPGYSWNTDYTIDKNYSVLGFFNAETTITATTVTPWNTSITEGWNMLYLMGTTNQTLTAICTNMVNCTDIYYYNSISNDYDNTGTDTIQPNQGFLAYVNQTGTWIRSTI